MRGEGRRERGERREGDQVRKKEAIGKARDAERERRERGKGKGGTVEDVARQLGHV